MSARRVSRRRKKTNYGKLLFYAVAVIAVGIGLAYFQDQQTQTTVQALSEVPTTVATTDGSFWWNNDYGYRRKLNISNTTTTIAVYEFDHTELVTKKYSAPTGGDLRLVAQIDQHTDTLNYSLTDANTASAQLKFDISKYPTANYYLYFGNYDPSAQVLGANFPQLAQAGERATADVTETPLVAISTDKYWVLTRKAGTPVNLNLKVSDTIWEEEAKVYYKLVNESDDPIQMEVPAPDATVALDLGHVDTGIRSLYVVLQTEHGLYRSANIKFAVSEPMFVAWTVDWEGRDVQDWVLESFAAISAQYSAPITHFFNPRIYIDGVMAEYRRNELTNWVKNRLTNNGDELSMHMHMYYDLVRAAGVTPQTSPRWGTGVDGYDVLSSDYSYDEYTKILKWGLEQFTAHGLPRPAGYRAGGWFANLEVLKAINDYGFVYDSSGREEYEFGIKKAKGFWSLPHTTQPYHPSTTNQNAASPEPVFSLWEVPNNGNDSYWFTGQEMLDRFNQNYTAGAILSTPKLVTYLSHPDWFDKDMGNMQFLLAELSKYTNTSDNGPVVFVTISDALKEWE